jgi:uncharacterized protein YjiS (DUF1127 family)
MQTFETKESIMSVNPSPKDLAFERCADGSHVLAPRSTRERLGAILRRTSDLLLGWQERARMRHALAAMDDRLLRDIGLTRSEALREFRKPFWRP